MENRGNFGSKIGIVLATAGSAVGLGNVWRFPFMVGQNGGAAFIVVYLGCILLLGIPGMVSEFIVGRHSQANAARAYASFSSGKGVKDGIERVSKLLMPLLFILLLIIVGASCSLPGAGKGVEFLLKPDFSKVDSQVFLEALGQAFFSLSLGTACLCTYASYFTRYTRLFQSATQIALVDFLIAVLAGLMIFPAAFSVGVLPDSGPSLIFITLPNVFQQAFAFMPMLGYVISIMFYALLVFAALTSTISMHEIGTAFFSEEFGMRRSHAAWILTIVCGLIAVFCSLSIGQADLQLFGKSLMDFCDFLTAQVMLPLGAMLTSILVGWFASKTMVREEFTNFETSSGKAFYPYYMFCVRYVVPVCILLILMHQFGVI